MRSHRLHMACAQFSPIEKFKYPGNQTILRFPTQHTFRQNNSVTDYILNFKCCCFGSYKWILIVLLLVCHDNVFWMERNINHYDSEIFLSPPFSQSLRYTDLYVIVTSFSLWAELPPCVMFRGVDFCGFHRKISLRFEGSLQVVE